MKKNHVKIEKQKFVRNETSKNLYKRLVDVYKDEIQPQLPEEKRNQEILDIYLFLVYCMILNNSVYNIVKALKKDREENTMTFINVPLTIKFESKPIKVVDDKITSDNKIIVRYSGCKKKRLDIDEAIKYIDECIADYNNSIE